MHAYGLAYQEKNNYDVVSPSESEGACELSANGDQITKADGCKAAARDENVLPNQKARTMQSAAAS